MWITFLERIYQSFYFRAMRYTEIPVAKRGRKRIYDFNMEVGECKEFDFSISVRQSAYKFFKDRGWDIATRSINNKLTIYRKA